MSHPAVEFIWNFWPYTVIVPNPIREILNIPFDPLRIFWFWVEDLWNFIPESLMFLVI